MSNPFARLVVPIVSDSPPLAEQIRDALALGADIVELRVDRLADIDAVEHAIRQFRNTPLIVTIRAADEGGAWDGDDAERIALFERLGLALPGLIDVEFAAWKRSANLRQKVLLVAQPSSAAPDITPLARARNDLILSAHNFRETPADLLGLVDALLSERPGHAKLVTRTADSRDALRLLLTLRDRPGRGLTLLGMGDAGLMTRVLAPKFGGALSYCSLAPGREAAPGQPTVSELRERFRWDRINPATRVYGVVGWPVGHSRSPLVHNRAMDFCGIDGVYVPMPVQPSEPALAEFLDSVAAHPELDIFGLSITIPHKEHTLAWASRRGIEITESARRAGAVNTLSRFPSGWIADNTDVAGFDAALDDVIAATPSFGTVKTALVLGSGGAARAVLAALFARGVQIAVSGRSPAPVKALCDEFCADWLDWDSRAGHRADLLVNTTPVGMSPNDSQSPMPAASLGGYRLVYDLVYTPARTRLIRDADQAGVATVSGSRMFIAQAGAQFERWHHQPLPDSAVLTIELS